MQDDHKNTIMNGILIIIMLIAAGCQSNLSELESFDRGLGFVSSDSNRKVDIFCSKDLKKTCATFKLKVDSAEFIEGLSVNEFDARLFEYEYESYGLPIIESGINYIKVLYPSGSDKYRHGYINIDQEKLEIQYWENHLIKRPLFFLDKESIKLYNYINGDTISFDKATFENHVLWPQAIKGNWMNVKYVSPSDSCVEKVNAEIINCWIRYLDDNGRPMVWYHPRGC